MGSFGLGGFLRTWWKAKIPAPDTFVATFIHSGKHHLMGYPVKEAKVDEDDIADAEEVPTQQLDKTGRAWWVPVNLYKVGAY